MFDLVIHSGTIIDGSGDAPYVGDIGIRDGVIVAIGGDQLDRDGATENIDATGKLVTPGWVDIHTHYDGQVTWDPFVTPSSWHGVTTVVMGNCGVGFAPCAPERRKWLVELMEGVEDIPGTALTEGMAWGWESFPEYLDFIEQQPRVLDTAAQIAHGPVRAHVMGERGARNEPATPDDIAAMADIVREAIVAGALGFSTSRTLMHKAIDGEPVPGTFAANDELFGIGDALRELDAGLFEVAPAGVAGEDDLAPPREMAWMRELAGRIGRPVTFGMTQSNASPEMYRDMLDAAADAAADGVQVVPQVAGRASGLLFGLDTTYHPFLGRPSFDALVPLDLEAKVAALRTDETRAAILAEAGAEQGSILAMADRIWRFTSEVDYEPHVDTSLASVAEATGQSRDELLYDWMLADEGQQLFMVPILNYADNTFDALREMLLHPQAVLGLSDGGAHCAIICDASIPTFMLTHWTRDRSRGEQLPLPYVVRKQTHDTAALYGLDDRGLLALGYKADVNVIDYDALALEIPQVVHDLPGGARRLVQRARGYVATVVSGTVVLRDDEHTGALPGAVVRGAQPAPLATPAG